MKKAYAEEQEDEPPVESADAQVATQNANP